jgi:hypothetical protein
MVKDWHKIILKEAVETQVNCRSNLALFRWAEANHDKPQSRQSMSLSRFNPCSTPAQVRSVEALQQVMTWELIQVVIIRITSGIFWKFQKHLWPSGNLKFPFLTITIYESLCIPYGYYKICSQTSHNRSRRQVVRYDLDYGGVSYWQCAKYSLSLLVTPDAFTIPHLSPGREPDPDVSTSAVCNVLHQGCSHCESSPHRPSVTRHRPKVTMKALAARGHQVTVSSPQSIAVLLFSLV